LFTEASSSNNLGIVHHEFTAPAIVLCAVQNEKSVCMQHAPQFVTKAIIKLRREDRCGYRNVAIC